MAIETMDLPIKNGDFPVRYVSHYQRVTAVSTCLNALDVTRFRVDCRAPLAELTALEVWDKHQNCGRVDYTKYLSQDKGGADRGQDTSPYILGHSSNDLDGYILGHSWTFLDILGHSWTFLDYYYYYYYYYYHYHG